MRSMLSFVICVLLCLAVRPSQATINANSTDVPAIAHSPTTLSSPEVVGGSCYGHRSEVIDDDYCHAVFPDRNCDQNNVLDGPNGCADTGDVLADCEASCAPAGGCLCRFESRECEDASDIGCWTAWCMAPEEPLYVGSCAFLTNELSCESIAGCQWAPTPVTNGVATQSTTTSSSSGISVVGIVFVVVGSILGLVLLCGAVALVVLLAIKYQQKEKSVDLPETEPDATASNC